MNNRILTSLVEKEEGLRSICKCKDISDVSESETVIECLGEDDEALET